MLGRALRIAVSVLAAILLSPASAWAQACPAGGEHDYQATLVQQATDDDDGLRRFTCRKCGESFDQTISATGHEWGPWITDVEPTCTSTGVAHRVCTRHPGAEHREERPLEALSPTGEHTWEETARIEPTCEGAGETRLRCAVCGQTTVRQLPAVGHDWAQWQEVRSATELAAGLERRLCRNDASHVEERAIPTLPANVSSAGGRDDAGEGEASVPEPAIDAGPSEPSAPEAETSATPDGDSWAPNVLDAVLLGVDAVALAAFALLAAPLLHAWRWIAAHRRRAGQAAIQPVESQEGGRVL